ncbi:hypothetical protein BO70DRAFT_301279 [Aspergillus heteromorphus CBS 117.55]|uniref:Uncharacterized protein n=1 Tax=Aspergillus heteromorphus CBS 117.55 TaxID=1448321 RepID=A0A317UYS0_9EURO|nr:uncharacterized protein BO70DRAFT_301279 [Aspergillus heteromorphus CBS 117.55]PWY67214.1 hypothetical protein BO70DRAFT_301279 [Aspergillus heteromorphus CBS 117.55]
MNTLKEQRVTGRLGVDEPSPVKSSPPVLSPRSPAAESRYSRIGSRRLAGLRTLFRSRKSQHFRLDSEGSGISGTGTGTGKQGRGGEGACVSGVDVGTGAGLDTGTGTPQRVGLQTLAQRSGYLNDDIEARKISDKTVHSLNSDLTSVTVCHNPSKHMSMPIALAEQGGLYHNRYSDIQEGSHSTLRSSLVLDNGRTTRAARQPSSDCSGASAPSTYPFRAAEKPDNPFARAHSSESGGSSRRSSDISAALDDGLLLAQGDRRAAAIAFNELASRLHLERVELVETQCDHGGSGWGHPSAERSHDSRHSYTATADRLARRRDRFYGRIRTMRSTLQLGSSPDAPRKRTLRRMRSFASMSRRSYEMTSLKGKPLDHLARLGGHNLLALPADFAPTKLRLPVCFVATITYLGCFAPTVRNVFVDSGNPRIATRTYDYFANQVLSAEREQDRIQMTVGSSAMPPDVVNPLHRDADGGETIQVQSVAWAFKALLAGLPGGILGSDRLYRALVQICHGHFAAEQVERRSSCLGGFSPRGYIKVKAIGLAILALSDSLRLNLICGVFGLGALLLHETQRLVELERQGFRGSVCRASVGSGLLNVDRLSGVLGPLLTDRGENESEDTFRAIEREIEGQRVAGMLVDSWRGVSRQLRIWQHRGAVAHQRAFSRGLSGESAEDD